jgi:hypothetical protein
MTRATRRLLLVVIVASIAGLAAWTMRRGDSELVAVPARPDAGATAPAAIYRPDGEEPVDQEVRQTIDPVSGRELPEGLEPAPPHPQRGSDPPEAPTAWGRAFEEGRKVLTTHARQCAGSLGEAASGALVRFSIAVTILGEQASSGSLEVLEGADLGEAFTSCLENELPGREWPAPGADDGDMTVEFDLPLSELR